MNLCRNRRLILFCEKYVRQYELKIRECFNNILFPTNRIQLQTTISTKEVVEVLAVFARARNLLPKFRAQFKQTAIAFEHLLSIFVETLI